MRRLLLVTAALVSSAAAGGNRPDPLAMAWNRFAQAGNQFAEGLRNGVFDQRQAQRLSKLWREVEQSGSWPEAK